MVGAVPRVSPSGSEELCALFLATDRTSSGHSPLALGYFQAVKPQFNAGRQSGVDVSHPAHPVAKVG
ncbi:MAG: hypothetical protein ACI974_000290 [Paraglaciecola sp.]|jgi:hypothetical protein